MDKLFKQLVDSTEPTIDSSLQKDLTGVYEHYQLNYENSLSFAHVQEYLYKIICENLVGDQLYTTQLSKLKDQLLLVHLIKNKELQPYLGILEIIIGAIKNGRVSTTNQSIRKLVNLDCGEKWQNALQAAKDLTVIYPKLIEDYTPQYLERCYKRQLVISNAAIFLRSEGYKIDCEHGKVVIEESEARRIANQIEANIKLLGGIEALRRLFEIIEPHYQNEQGRYYLGVNVSFVPKDYSPLIPIGYLLNLCVKNLPEKRMRFEISNKNIPLTFEKADEVWEEILESSISLTSILDVQPHNRFMLLFQSPETIIPFLKNLAVYDSLFSPIQLRPSDVSKMIKGLFCWLTTDIERRLGWTPYQAATIAERIFKLAADNLYPITFQLEEMYDLEKQIGKGKIQKILTVYSHTLNSVNSNFQIPQDLSEINYKNYFQSKPLIQLSKDRYLLTNSSFCSPAFYEAIVSELREKVDSKINDKLGEKIEDFIKNEFSIRGIEFKSGRYDNSPDEIDILVEASDTLIFFEVKTKPLTRKAKCGDDLALLFDLSNSLITSQIQINKHEIFIRKNGCISLKDSSICELKGRNIERISMTLLDFGSFQDRTIIFNFLDNMLLGKFEAINDLCNDYLNQKIGTLNEKLNKFKCQFDELVKLDSTREESRFGNCWFLSVPQLLLILDNVHSSDELKNELWRTRHVELGVIDFYKDYGYARRFETEKNSS
jgi:hypothetical protein